MLTNYCNSPLHSYDKAKSNFGNEIYFTVVEWLFPKLAKRPNVGKADQRTQIKSLTRGVYADKL